MRLVTFERAGARAIGAVEGDRVVELGSGEMTELVAGGEESLRAAREAVEKAERVHALGDVRLLVPLRPPVILNSGQNYWDHRDEKPTVDPKDSEFFLKAPLAVIGPGDAIVSIRP
jgi:2-keto-4-pentenoate hydratase/2-oxohepta-3-ene-1,7-dioic acid hydratase in catechol pathway